MLFFNAFPQTPPPTISNNLPPWDQRASAAAVAGPQGIEEVFKHPIFLRPPASNA